MCTRQWRENRAQVECAIQYRGITLSLSHLPGRISYSTQFHCPPGYISQFLQLSKREEWLDLAVFPGSLFSGGLWLCVGESIIVVSLILLVFIAIWYPGKFTFTLHFFRDMLATVKFHRYDREIYRYIRGILSLQPWSFMVSAVKFYRCNREI